jgi:hypothetical protein
MRKVACHHGEGGRSRAVGPVATPNVGHRRAQPRGGVKPVSVFARRDEGQVGQVEELEHQARRAAAPAPRPPSGAGPLRLGALGHHRLQVVVHVIGDPKGVLAGIGVPAGDHVLLAEGDQVVRVLAVKAA